MKKIISLLLVCFMVMSMAVIAGAAPTGSTISVAKLTTADIVEDVDAGNYYMVAVSMDKLYSDTTDLKKGYNALQFDLLYDDTKVAPHDYGVWGTDEGWGWSYKQGPAWKKEAMSGEASIVTDASTGKKGVRVVCQTGSQSKTLLQKGVGDGTLLYFAFKPLAKAKGKAAFEVKNCVFSVADLSDAHYDADFTLVAGEIDLGGEVVTPKYTVTATAGANGSIAEKDGKTEGATGDVLTYNITADTGYVIDTITVDGVADTSKAGQASATITYTVAEAAGAISVTFKAEETETTIATIGRYKDATALYTLGKVVVGTNGCTRYGVAVQSVKRGEEVYYSGSGKTDEGYYVVGFTGTAYDNNAATKAFADITDAASRIFGAEVSEYTAE